MGVNLLKNNMFTFAGKDSKDFGLLLSGFDAYDTPARDIENVVVPGRDGELTIDKGRFSNVNLTYKCLVYRDFMHEYEGFRSFMASCVGYQRLEDTFHPDEFRLAVFKTGVTPKLKGNYEAASFDLTFNCKPQRWLKSGDETITLTNNGVILNALLFAAKPLIRVYAAGTLTVGTQTLVISNVSGYTDIDCDVMNAYKGSVNKNATVSGTFPKLNPGENEISFSGGRVDITPRWFTL